MKKLFIILLFPLAANAQLSTNQKSQVTTMIATAIKPLNDKITTLIADTLAKSKRISVLQSKVDSLTVSLDPLIFNTINKVITIPAIPLFNDRLTRLETKQ